MKLQAGVLLAVCALVSCHGVLRPERPSTESDPMEAELRMEPACKPKSKLGTWQWSQWDAIGQDIAKDLTGFCKGAEDVFLEAKSWHARGQHHEFKKKPVHQVLGTPAKTFLFLRKFYGLRTEHPLAFQLMDNGWLATTRPDERARTGQVTGIERDDMMILCAQADQLAETLQAMKNDRCSRSVFKALRKSTKIKTESEDEDRFQWGQDTDTAEQVWASILLVAQSARKQNDRSE
jgi:hypothetical protein